MWLVVEEWLMKQIMRDLRLDYYPIIFIYLSKSYVLFATISMNDEIPGREDFTA